MSIFNGWPMPSSNVSVTYSYYGTHTYPQQTIYNIPPAYIQPMPLTHYVAPNTVSSMPYILDPATMIQLIQYLQQMLAAMNYPLPEPVAVEPEKKPALPVENWEFKRIIDLE